MGERAQQYRAALSESANQKNWPRLVEICEQYELEIMSRGTLCDDNMPLFAVHLCTYLILNDLNNARFLWKRIPVDVREENNELKQIWEIGKHMWNRQYADVYQAIQTFSWPQPLGGLVQILKESYQNRTYKMICSAYSSISAERGGQLLGLSSTEILDFYAKQGWSKLEDGSNYYQVVPLPSAEKPIDLAHVPDLTKYIVFLESV